MSAQAIEVLPVIPGPRRAQRLRRVSCSGPGMSRRRRGKGFEYRAIDGSRITDAETLARIQELVIPPAWKDVWICPDPRGHLQAVGTDAKGRRQYLYHPMWRQRQDQLKHERVLDVATRLPRARKQAAADLAGRGLTRERVLACAFRLLDLGFFRVGGEEYAEENGSFGLATLHREHVTLRRDGGMTFEYTAKHGVQWNVTIRDEACHGVVAALTRRMRAEEQLFCYREGGRWLDMTAADVNEYVHRRQVDATAKDFRTWHGTVLAAVHLGAAFSEAQAAGKVPMSDRARKRAITGTMKAVSSYLGNTPAVCRASYVDPRVVERFGEGLTIARALRGVTSLEPPFAAAQQSRIERAVLGLLR